MKITYVYHIPFHYNKGSQYGVASSELRTSEPIVSRTQIESHEALIARTHGFDHVTINTPTLLRQFTEQDVAQEVQEHRGVLGEQIDRLAQTILELNLPVHDEGACEAAARIIREQKQAIEQREAVGACWAANMDQARAIANNAAEGKRTVVDLRKELKRIAALLTR